MVEQALRRAIRSMRERDPELARYVIEEDRQIDQEEVNVEEECLGLLALHHPVAHDLRYVVAVLKINKELERIGDLAANIAEQALAMTEEAPVPDHAVDLIMGMAQRTQVMVKKSINALVDVDANLATEVRRSDDDVDRMLAETYELVEAGIRENVDRLTQFVRLLNIARHLERIADHGVNIAKEVLYISSGEIVRHRRARTGESGAQATEGDDESNDKGSE